MKLSRWDEVRIIKRAILDAITREEVKNESGMSNSIGIVMDVWKDYSKEQDLMSITTPLAEQADINFAWHDVNSEI